jgi:hypothetical protein
MEMNLTYFSDELVQYNFVILSINLVDNTRNFYTGISFEAWI